MSANSAVTVLRSPSICWEIESRSVATLIWYEEIGLVLADAGRAAPTAVPHFLQNRAPKLSDALHAGQASSSFDPHDSQNEASAGLSLLHFAQSIGLPVQFIKQRLSVFQIGGVEALGEPPVDVGEQHRAPRRGDRYRASGRARPMVARSRFLG